LSLDTKPDVLTIALFVAAVAHALVIGLTTFNFGLQELKTPPSLEVILVQQSDSERPEEADYLAESAQDGGGESDDRTRPASPFTSDQDLDTDGIAPTPMVASAPKPAEAADDAVLTTLYSDRDVNTETEEQDSKSEAELQAEIEIEQSFELARLQAEIDKQQEQTAKRPKKKWLTARTHEATSAKYMYNWVEKVERIGNLNYPDAIRREQLSGAVVMTVGIFKNGSIESILIEESSGQRILDDAAKRIVQLASPFDPLLGKLGDETDILYITRTWDFQSSNSVISY